MDEFDKALEDLFVPSTPTVTPGANNSKFILTEEQKKALKWVESSDDNNEERKKRLEAKKKEDERLASRVRKRAARRTASAAYEKEEKERFKEQLNEQLKEQPRRKSAPAGSLNAPVSPLSTPAGPPEMDFKKIDGLEWRSFNTWVLDLASGLRDCSSSFNRIVPEESKEFKVEPLKNDETYNPYNPVYVIHYFKDFWDKIKGFYGAEKVDSKVSGTVDGFIRAINEDDKEWEEIGWENLKFSKDSKAEEPELNKEHYVIKAFDGWLEIIKNTIINLQDNVGKKNIEKISESKKMWKKYNDLVKKYNSFVAKQSKIVNSESSKKLLERINKNDRKAQEIATRIVHPIFVDEKFEGFKGSKGSESTGVLKNFLTKQAQKCEAGKASTKYEKLKAILSDAEMIEGAGTLCTRLRDFYKDLMPSNRSLVATMLSGNINNIRNFSVDSEQLGKLEEEFNGLLYVVERNIDDLGKVYDNVEKAYKDDKSIIGEDHDFIFGKDGNNCWRVYQNENGTEKEIGYIAEVYGEVVKKDEKQEKNVFLKDPNGGVIPYKGARTYGSLSDFLRGSMGYLSFENNFTTDREIKCYYTDEEGKDNFVIFNANGMAIEINRQGQKKEVDESSSAFKQLKQAFEGNQSSSTSPQGGLDINNNEKNEGGINMAENKILVETDEERNVASAQGIMTGNAIELFNKIRSGYIEFMKEHNKFVSSNSSVVNEKDFKCLGNYSSEKWKEKIRGKLPIEIKGNEINIRKLLENYISMKKFFITYVSSETQKSCEYQFEAAEKNANDDSTVGNDVLFVNVVDARKSLQMMLVELNDTLKEMKEEASVEDEAPESVSETDKNEGANNKSFISKGKEAIFKFLSRLVGSKEDDVKVGTEATKVIKKVMPQLKEKEVKVLSDSIVKNREDLYDYRGIEELFDETLGDKVAKNVIIDNKSNDDTQKDAEKQDKNVEADEKETDESVGEANENENTEQKEDKKATEESESSDDIKKMARGKEAIERVLNESDFSINEDELNENIKTFINAKTVALKGYTSQYSKVGLRLVDYLGTYKGRAKDTIDKKLDKKFNKDTWKTGSSIREDWTIQDSNKDKSLYTLLDEYVNMANTLINYFDKNEGDGKRYANFLTEAGKKDEFDKRPDSLNSSESKMQFLNDLIKSLGDMVSAIDTQLKELEGITKKWDRTKPSDGITNGSMIGISRYNDYIEKQLRTTLNKYNSFIKNHNDFLSDPDAIEIMDEVMNKYNDYDLERWKKEARGVEEDKLKGDTVKNLLEVCDDIRTSSESFFNRTSELWKDSNVKCSDAHNEKLGEKGEAERVENYVKAVDAMVGDLIKMLMNLRTVHQKEGKSGKGAKDLIIGAVRNYNGFLNGYNAIYDKCGKEKMGKLVKDVLGNLDEGSSWVVNGRKSKYKLDLDALQSSKSYKESWNGLIAALNGYLPEKNRKVYESAEEKISKKIDGSKDESEKLKLMEKYNKMFGKMLNYTNSVLKRLKRKAEHKGYLKEETAEEKLLEEFVEKYDELLSRGYEIVQTIGNGLVFGIYEEWRLNFLEGHQLYLVDDKQCDVQKRWSKVLHDLINNVLPEGNVKETFENKLSDIENSEVVGNSVNKSKVLEKYYKLSEELFNATKNALDRLEGTEANGGETNVNKNAGQKEETKATTEENKGLFSRIKGKASKLVRKGKKVVAHKLDNSKKELDAAQKELKVEDEHAGASGAEGRFVKQSVMDQPEYETFKAVGQIIVNTNTRGNFGKIFDKLKEGPSSAKSLRSKLKVMITDNNIDKWKLEDGKEFEAKVGVLYIGIAYLPSGSKGIEAACKGMSVGGIKENNMDEVYAVNHAMKKFCRDGIVGHALVKKVKDKLGGLVKEDKISKIESQFSTLLKLKREAAKLGGKAKDTAKKAAKKIGKSSVGKAAKSAATTAGGAIKGAASSAVKTVSSLPGKFKKSKTTDNTVNQTSAQAPAVNTKSGKKGGSHKGVWKSLRSKLPFGKKGETEENE